MNSSPEHAATRADAAEAGGERVRGEEGGGSREGTRGKWHCNRGYQ